MPKIPATMATQHPDNAMPVYFTGQRYISAQEETEECFRSFSELGMSEYMWDWEGKFVDEAVTDRLFNRYHDYFSKNQIGKDIFLTFRIPNIWIESSHKLPRAFMNMISSEHAAKTHGLHCPPVFEVILPMTTSASQLEYIQKTFSKISKATQEIFDLNSSIERLSVIPLFEEYETMADAKGILQKYTKFLKDEYGYTPKHMRVFIARSDPAMNAGLLPAKLVCKHAINAYHTFAEETGIEIYPIVGSGSLPFRGGINPENIEPAIEEHKGIATFTIQSAFRYDYQIDEVKEAIRKIETNLQKNLKKWEKISEEEGNIIKSFNRTSAGFYQSSIEKISDIINTIAPKIPSHRERVQHIGLFGYSRGQGKVRLPRAITFTGSLYSIGIPPELIGTGRSLKHARDMGILDLIKRLCPYLKEDLLHAGHYLNRENLNLLCSRDESWKVIREEISYIENFLGEEIGPTKPHHMIHRNYSSNIYQRLLTNQDFADDTLKAAEIRKSLG